MNLNEDPEGYLKFSIWISISKKKVYQRVDSLKNKYKLQLKNIL